MSERIRGTEVDSRAVKEAMGMIKDTEKWQAERREIVTEQFSGENTNGVSKQKTNLPNTEEQKLQLDEKTEENTAESSIFCTTFSEVQEILLEVVNKVSTEKTAMENIEPYQNGNSLKADVDFNRKLKLLKSCEEMETTGVDNVINNDVQKHGTKRSCDDATLDGVPANDDSSYVMNLVQEELDAVEKQLDTRKGVKIVDYDIDSDESSSSEGSSESSSDSESTSSESSVDERIIIDKVECEDEKLNVGAPKTKDEILLNELPPAPLVDLVLADDVNVMHIGVIISIVECIVVIRALPKTPAVDADTLLFLENRKCLGKVFETFGPVQSPFYSVRFNSPDSITKADINVDMMVFFVPDDLDMTKLIFTSQIEKLKGSDASWKHDQEPPDELIEYSDDEEEAVAKAKKKQARKGNKQGQNGLQPGASSQHSNKPQQPRELPHTFRGQGRGRNAQRNQERHPPPGVAPPLPPGLTIPSGIHMGLYAPRSPMPMLSPLPRAKLNHPLMSTKHPPPPPSVALSPPLLGQHEHPGHPLLHHPPRPFPPGFIPPPHPGQFAPVPLQSPPVYPHYQPPPPPSMPSGPGTCPPWPPFNLRPSRQ